MSIEGTEAQVETQEATETQETPSTMLVELGGGVKAELPVEDAKKYIQYQDSRNASHRELSSNYDMATKSIKELSEKTKLLETIKESQYDEVKAEIETRLKSEYGEKLSELSNKLLNTAVDVAIAKQDGIVTDEAARNDLKQLFVSTHKDLTDDVESISQKLNEFVKAKPHFLRATSEPAKPPVNKSKVTSPTPEPSYSEAIRGLFNL